MDKHLELFQELDARITGDARPSEYLGRLQDPTFFEPPFTIISGLKNVPQSPRHHPEGSVWNHTLLVVDEAAKRKHQANDKRAFMWSALLHDVGKARATKTRKDKITAYDHDKIGAPMAADFLRRFSDDDAFVSCVAALVRWHMQILYVTKNLPFSDIETMKHEADADDVALLCLCDRLGRKDVDRKKEEQSVRQFLKEAGRG